MRAPDRSSSWLNEMLFLRTAGTSRIGMATIPKLIDPVHTGRAIEETLSNAQLLKRGRSRQSAVSQLRQALFRGPEQGLEGVTHRLQALEHAVDRPAVGPQLRAVELVPLQRHRHRRA